MNTKRSKKSDAIQDRIREAMGDRTLACYWAILGRVFPENDYPKAGRRSNNGGPMGCQMAYGRAIREMGGRWWNAEHGGRELYIPRKKEAAEP